MLELTARVREKCDVPIVLMGYYNPIFRMGEEEFVKQARKAGVDGLIVADLPIEESLTLEMFCMNEGIHLIQLVAPTTPEDRMMHIAGRSSGYLYLVSRLGTTGARGTLSEKLPALIETGQGGGGGPSAGGRVRCFHQGACRGDHRPGGGRGHRRLRHPVQDHRWGEAARDTGFRQGAEVGVQKAMRMRRVRELEIDCSTPR